MKGQFSLEFLTTYGWAFIVVLIAAGALAYYGVFSPGQYIPDSCDITPELVCVDYAILSSDNSVNFHILNNYEKDIYIEFINASVYPGEITCREDFSITSGFSEVVTCAVTEYDFVRGEKAEVKLDINFRRNSPSATVHTVRGEIFTSVV